MGRNKYKKDLGQQVYNNLQKKLATGRSRDNDKKIGIDTKYIYSFKTYHTYANQCRYFARWIQREHPDAKSLKYARNYYNEYMTYLEHSGKYSASSLHTTNAALMKLFGIEKTDKDFYQAPVRHKEDFVRSRGIKESDKHFSEKNNQELVNFCRGIGARAGVLEKLTGDDYFSRERIINELDRIGKLPEKERSERENILYKEGMVVLNSKFFQSTNDFVFHYKDKHGKSRLAPIIGIHKNDIVDRFLNTRPNQKVWEHIPRAMDVHSYRSDYATQYYRSIARDIKDIPYDSVNRGTGKRYQSQVYSCRSGDKGKHLDRVALYEVSAALGHNRAEVVPKNYLKGI